MKFDVEGEEHYIIPNLIKNNLLSKFDVIYSEFHTGDINNPLKSFAKNTFAEFINYSEVNGIETYEEEKISEKQLNNYNCIYEDLVLCKGNKYN